LFWEAFSFASSFAATLLMVWRKPMTLLVAVALAAALFFLFGPFGLIGYGMALTVRLALPGSPIQARKQKSKK
jgi:hypothetical protein